jgi:beta-hydroxylase
MDTERRTELELLQGGASPMRRADPPPAPAKTFRERAYDVAMALMAPLAEVVTRTSKVPTTPFLRAEDFAWTRPLEEGWRDMRRELESVLVYKDDLPHFHDINGDATDIRNDAWKSFFLYGFGRRAEESCRRCPRTAELVSQVPGMKTAFFSILGPGARLPPHRGPWRGFLRYHLGLMVPEPADKIGILVGGQEGHWREGRSLMFDDTYEHSVWNDTAGTRVVLFLDVVRPCRFPGSLVNRAVIGIAGLTPFVRNSIKRHKKWERLFGQKHGRAARAHG